MCTVPVGLAVLQGIGSYQAQSQQYSAQASAYEAQAQAAQNNAKIAEIQGSQTADAYAQRQQQLNSKRKLALGQQSAAAGASGLSGVGSVLDSGSAVEDAWKEDSLNLLGNQRIDTMASYVNQVNYRNQANADRAAASNVRAQSKSALLGTILGTATSIYGLKNNYGASATKSATNAFTQPWNFSFSEQVKQGKAGYSGWNYYKQGW